MQAMKRLKLRSWPLIVLVVVVSVYNLYNSPTIIYKESVQEIVSSLPFVANHTVDLSNTVLRGQPVPTTTQGPTDSCPPAPTPRREGADNFAPKGTCSLYVESRHDRSGAIISSMLAGHAAAYYWGFQYGGACGYEPEIIDVHKPLIDALGLQDVLTFACPDNQTRGYIMPWKQYLLTRQYFTQDWRQYLQLFVFQATSRVPNDGFIIAVHIRRGDVAPCMKIRRKIVNSRFTPNQYYLDVLDEYSTPNSTVRIYSESHSFQSFDEFRQRGYQLILDGSVADAMRGMVDADMLIAANSAFSVVPAQLTRGQVIWNLQFGDPWFPHMKVPNERIVERNIRVLREEMIQKCTREMRESGGPEAYWANKSMHMFD